MGTIFKAFLRYVYSYSFAPLEALVAKEVAQRGASSAASSSVATSTSTAHRTEMSILQQLLAVGHKYQLTPLQLWCQRELCACISSEDVCSVLCQAHLYDATQLEKKCLDFITAHMNEVVKTDAFGSLSQEWPEVHLKITLHCAGITESSAATAIEKHQNARKRKRLE